ncbi:MAG: hypothetical protein Fur0024_3090 [Patescibacteria group bacterium]
MNKGQILAKISEKSLSKKSISVRVGDKVVLHVKIKEEKRERVQLFEGFVTSVKHGNGINGRFTVRRVGKDGIAVERIFPLHSEFIEKIEVIKSFRVRRAKLNYLKDRVGTLKLPELRGKLKGKRLSFVAKTEEISKDEKSEESVENSDLKNLEENKNENQNLEDSSVETTQDNEKIKSEQNN